MTAGTDPNDTSLAMIETPRFDLRPVRSSDQGLIELYASDRRVARMTPSLPHPLPTGMIAAMIDRAKGPEAERVIWVIDGLKSGGGEVMGLITLDTMDRAQSEVSYWVAPAFWNTGLASDALKALIAANPLGNVNMFASVFQDNFASARLLTNCGFEYLGAAECFCVARNATVPTWTYTRKFGGVI